LIVQRPQIEEEVVGDNRSRFIVEPLEPGFGYTLGNTLRRTLLSRIPGAAITSVRIEGVQHEFSTVPGVTEDVVDLILNLKQVVLRSEVDGAQTLYLSAKGKGDVTAGDIKAPAGVEIINDDHHIATLSSSGKLEIEMRHCPSRGLLNQSEHIEAYEHYCEHCDVLYRHALEPLGFNYSIDLSTCREARCRLAFEKKPPP